jgi:hypothetical protein
MGEHEDLDQLTRDQLADLDGPAHAVAAVLDEWNHREHGVTSSSHGVGLFLDLLAAEGLQVTPTAQTPTNVVVNVHGSTMSESGLLKAIQRGMDGRGR